MEIQDNLNDSLREFYCTSQYYKHQFGFLYTDGVQYMASEYGAYWLLDDIGLYIKSQPRLKANLHFQTWVLKRYPATNGQISFSFILSAEDGNSNKLFETEIIFSDFKANEVTLWFESGVLLLPSEH